MVIEIGVAQRQRVDALRHHLGYAVLDSLWPAEVGEAARQARQQPDSPVGAAQQQSAGIGGHRSPFKSSHHTP